MGDGVQGIIAEELAASFRTLAVEVVLMRVAAAILLAGVIGAEREWRHRPAGLRTHMLVSLAACLYAIIGREIVMLDVLGAGDQLRVDPMNLIQAVTSGVAFLVAGIIITSGGRVQNVTTGASLWLAGAIGLACGAGLIPIATIATVAVILVLMVLAAVVKHDPAD